MKIITGGGSASSAENALKIVKGETEIAAIEPKKLRVISPADVKTELQKEYEKRHEKKIDRTIQKVDDNIHYINNRLDAMIKETLEQINSDMSPDEIKDILMHYDKKWRTFCANTRKTTKYTKIESDAFESQIQSLIYNVDKITETKEIFESRVKFYNKNWFTKILFRIKMFFKRIASWI